MFYICNLANYANKIFLLKAAKVATKLNCLKYPSRTRFNKKHYTYELFLVMYTTYETIYTTTKATHGYIALLRNIKQQCKLGE